MLLLSVIAGVRIDVLLSFQGNDMMTSFQAVAAGLGNGDDAVKNSGRDGFWFVDASFSPFWPPSTSPASCWTCS